MVVWPDHAGKMIRERTIGEYGMPVEGIWLHLTDYSRLRPPNSKESFCKIEEAHKRGVTLVQLMRVWRFVQEHCGPEGDILFWVDRQRGKGVMGYDMNLYALNEWVIGPSTYEFRCSFSEILATSAEQQVHSPAN